jgi:drug/metabolite transporter (DMT)-like permease
MKTTNVVRVAVIIAFLTTVGVALGGWLLGKDPNSLLGILGVVVAAMGVGEASNVGKRATTKTELMAK